MKKTIIFFILFAVIVSKANADVPAKVSKAFKAKYTKVEDLSWDNDGNEYYATFTHEGLSKSATFDENGVWIETTTSLSADDLKTCITDIIEEDYSEYEVLNAEQIASPDYDYTYVNLAETEDEDQDEGEEADSIRLKFETVSCKLAAVE